MTKYILILALAGACNGAVLTTYAKHYSDEARAYAKAHPHHVFRRYHPDSLFLACGHREWYGLTVWVQHGMMKVKCRVTDCMNKRYDDDSVDRFDASPRVMRALRLSGKAEVIVIVDSQSLIKHNHKMQINEYF